MATLSIIIPAYNEGGTITSLLKAIGEVKVDGFSLEVIVVDDGSSDNTVEEAEQHAAGWSDGVMRVVSLGTNRGKGAAIRRGISLSTGDYLLVQDADLEYNPAEYPRLLSPVVRGEADVVYGSRMMGGNRDAFFTAQYYANRVLTLLSNLRTGLNLTDMETCYKLFRGDLIRSLKLVENRFGFEPEVTAKIASIKGVRITEVPVSYRGRSYSQGKKISWKDAVRAIYCIMKY